MKKVIFSFILLLTSQTIMAQTYTTLWKRVTEAQQKDLPKSQMKTLSTIIEKAENENQFGQLIKARLLRATLQSQISPDSTVAELSKLKTIAEKTPNPALKAVYAAIIGKVYQLLGTKSALRESKQWQDLSMSNPALLAKKKCTAFQPAIIYGMDSKIFYDDLLHVIGMEAEAYHTLYEYYSQAKNRAAACLCAYFDLKSKQPDYIPEIRKSKYVQKIDSLINVYSDLREAGELAIERYRCMNMSNDATAQEKDCYINYALNKWGAWPRMNILRNAQSELQRPSFTLNLGDEILLPNVRREVRVNSIRNINSLYVNVFPVEIDGSTTLNPAVKADWDKLQKYVKPSVMTYQLGCIGQPAWKERSDSLYIVGLPVGVYLVEATTDNNNIEPQRALLRVSDLYAIHENLPDKHIRFVVVNATTGAPVPNAHIRLEWESYDSSKNKNTVKLTTGRNGEVNYQYRDTPPTSIYVYTNKDRASAKFGFDGYMNRWTKTPLQHQMQIFTDRSIYRPGQTVHVATMAFTKNNNDFRSQATESLPVTLTLTDANNKTIATKEVTTDAFGMVSADFTLPTHTLNGAFSLRASAKPGYSAFQSIRVEEYKRPTFAISFNPYDKTYHIGDTIKLTGRALGFNGTPLQGAKVVYSVKRESAFWWRWNMGKAKTLVQADSTTTADNGDFTASVPLLIPEDVNPERPLLYNIVVTAKVTAINGETHEAETNIPLSNRTAFLSCNLPTKQLKDSLKTFSFTRKNIMGEMVSGVVNYRFDNGNWQKANANTPISIITKLQSGKHQLLAICDNDTLKQDFVVFSYGDKRPAIVTPDWFYVSASKFSADDKPVYLQIGSSDKDVHIFYTVCSDQQVIDQGEKTLNNEVHTRKLYYKESYGDGITINLAWVKAGKLYRHHIELARPLPSPKLNLTWKTFRDRLTPGQKEQWTLQITNAKNQPAQAQLLATMYDASLDQILPHTWQFSNPYTLTLPQTRWNGNISDMVALYGFEQLKLLNVRPLDFSHFDPQLFDFEWPASYFIGEGYSPYYYRGYALARSQQVMTRAMALNQTMNKENIEDLSPYQQELPVNKTTTATEINEDRQTGEKGNVADKANQKVQFRENFNPTAFFSPALQTDAKGNINIRFTLPQSLTTWRFMGLAHDKEINYGMLDATIIAQKTVMVQPNMPRFLRVGDKTTMQTRIVNTSSAKVNGMAHLQILDPETERVLCQWSKPFVIGAHLSQNVGFALDGAKLNNFVPNSHLVIVRISAEGKGYSDGEQHYLPLLPDEELVTSTMPFTLSDKDTVTLNIAHLFPTVSKSNRLTLEYTGQPAWLMIQALPTMAETNSKDAISLATAYYANGIGQYLLAKAPHIKTVINMWQQAHQHGQNGQSALQQNAELKNIMLSETPWLNEAMKEEANMQQLAGFLNEGNMAYRNSNALSQLSNLQNNDGSFSWWQGMPGSRYMTTAIVKIMARLNAMTGIHAKTTKMLDKSFAYLNNVITEEVSRMQQENAKTNNSLQPIQQWVYDYLYACALAQKPMTTDIKYLLKQMVSQYRNMSITQKAQGAVILSAFGFTENAKDCLQSIAQYSVYKSGMGRYFDTNKAPYSWQDYRIPTQVAAIEALQTVGTTQSKMVSEMKEWLLQEKRTTAWSTPINSVDAIYAFLVNGKGKVQLPQPNDTLPPIIKIDGQQVILHQEDPALGYIKTTLPSGTAHKMTINAQQTGTAWGALYAQYWQKNTEVKTNKSGLAITREIRTNTTGSNGTPLLKVGDKVTVVLTIKAERDFDFVQIRDKRASCMTPVQQLSGYVNQYYYAPQDNVTDYFFDTMSKGTHVIKTEYFVDRSGNFVTGTCSVQCAYSPAFGTTIPATTIQVNE